MYTKMKLRENSFDGKMCQNIQLAICNLKHDGDFISETFGGCAGDVLLWDCRLIIETSSRLVRIQRRIVKT